MTVALCLFCGAEKWGCYTPCKECGAAPRDKDERDLSVYVSDHWIGLDRLRALQPRFAAALRDGRRVVVVDHDLEFPDESPPDRAAGSSPPAG
jgi:hypothetical protein